MNPVITEIIESADPNFRNASKSILKDLKKNMKIIM